MKDGALAVSIPESWSVLHCVAVAVGVFEDALDRELHACDRSPTVDVASCRRVFPDNVLLAPRLNLSLTRLRLKLGIEIALWRAVFNCCLFPSALVNVVVE